MKFSIEDFFSKFDQVWSHLLKKSLMENFTFCAGSTAENGSYIFRKQIKKFEISLKGNYFGKQKHIFIFTFLSHVTYDSIFCFH